MTNRFVGREYLTGVQYSSDANLAARQSLYRFQVPPVQNAVWTLDCAQLQGDERVLDVGCGNGVHLAELAARAHRGTVHGLDLSPGMLAAAGSRSAATLTVGDAEGLPFATGSLDAVFAMHMLYHVPDRDLAVAEIKRVLRSDGIALISTNSEQHLLELTEMIAAVEKAQGRPASGAGRGLRLLVGVGRGRARTTLRVGGTPRRARRARHHRGAAAARLHRHHDVVHRAGRRQRGRGSARDRP